MNYYEHHLGDYLRDTAHLSLVEDAVYRRLLDQYYIREAPLPLDVDECAKLARIAGKGSRAAVEYVLHSFFQRQADGWHQPRADQEIARYHDKRTKASRSANARWKPSERNANAMRTHSEGNALQTPDTRHKKEEGAGAPVIVPDGLDPKAWEAWVGYRKAIKKPLNPATHSVAMKQLAALGSGQMAAVEHSIANNYRGLFAPTSNGKTPPAKRERQPTPEEIAEARRKAAADNAASLQRLGFGSVLKAMP